MYIYSFENLEVWQKAREYVKTLYSVTNEFPSDERFGISSQLRRSAISVSSNIAEGSTRWSKKDKARFYEIAYGSLMENLNQLILAYDLKYLPEGDFIEMRVLIDGIAKKLSALYRSAKQGA